jgi:uncharacterized protein YoaH (UPF0181 family)
MARDGDLSPMDVAAVSMHEMFESFRRAGFSRGEAITIIAKVAAEIIAQQQAERGESGGDNSR